MFDVLRVNITNTFPSENDCDMFIMVLQHLWPTFIDKLPGARFRVLRSETDRNVMQSSWTVQSKVQADKMRAIGDEIIIPYRNKLMPKSIRFEGALLATVSNDD